MEPQTATALVSDDKVEVWVGTRTAREHGGASEFRGAEQVYVHAMHAGGGFGRRGPHQEYTKQAVLIAQTMRGTPVRVQVARGRHAAGPLSSGQPGEAARRAFARALIDGTCARPISRSQHGRIPNLEIKNGVDPINTRCFLTIRSVANFTNQYAMRNTHVPPGFWRAVAHTNNPSARVFHRRAQAAGKIRTSSAARCWKAPGSRRARCGGQGCRLGQPLPAGVHRGIAVSIYGSFTAAVVELVLRDDHHDGRVGPSTAAMCAIAMRWCGSRAVSSGV